MSRRQGKRPAAGNPRRNTENPELLALAQKVATLHGFQRTCPRPACKRTRRCVGHEPGCYRENPARPLPSGIAARRFAALRRQLLRPPGEAPP